MAVGVGHLTDVSGYNKHKTERINATKRLKPYTGH